LGDDVMNIGIILAGGEGSRMGNIDRPKQFIEVYGKPVVIHTLENFDIHPEIDAIAVVCLKEWQEELKILIRKFELNKVKWIIDGGKTRQESTLNALNVLVEVLNSDDIVVIHDSARPLITNSVISNNIKGANEFGAVDTIIPASDTIVRSLDGNKIFDIPVRRELYLGQTPQSFKFSIIKEAHEIAINNNIDNATDDCQLVLNTGKSVHLITGDKLNFKITTQEDLLLLKSIVKLGKLERI
jgi:D-ribitol-5-phosphate cytidylyltransferase